MRVIAGKWRGRPLVAFKASHIRPTTDRVKEVLFNKLQGEIRGARVLDLFGGTGSLTVEALSRGASFVVTVESSRRSLEIIRKNLRLLGAEGDAQLVSKDVLKFLQTSGEKGFDVILVDPPFDKKMADAVMTALAATELWHENSIIFIESSKHERLQENYGALGRISHKSFGDKFLSSFAAVDGDDT